MRSLLIIATIVALSAAKPGGYHHQHYQFEQSSAAYRNNELQHKSDEAGRYTKFEDLDSSDEPDENMNYHRTEYHAPSAAVGIKGGRRVWKPTTNRNLFAEDTQTNVDKEYTDSQTIATDLDSKIISAARSQVQEESQSHTSHSSDGFGSSSGTTSVNDHHPHFGHHFRGHPGRYPGHSGGYSGHDHSADFHRSHGEGFQRGYHGHHTEEFHRQHGEAFSGHHGHRSRFHLTTSEPEVLQPIEDDDTTFNYDKFKQYGFGKEYLDNTEGATNNAGTGISSSGRGIQNSGFASSSSTNTNRGPIGIGSSTINQNPGLTTSNIVKPNHEQNPVFTSSPEGSNQDRTTDISFAAAASSGITTSNIETTRPEQGSLFVSPTIPTNQNTAGSSGFTTNTAANSGFADAGNSQIGQENIKPVYEAPGSETIPQQSVPKASEDDLLHIYAKIDQIAKDMAETQQRETEHDMTGTHRLDQFGRDQLDIRHSKQQDILNIRTAQSFDSTQQQMQFGSQDFTQQSAVQFNQGQEKYLTQQTQVDDLIEKTDVDSGKLEVASQIRGDQHNDMTQHGQEHLQNKEDVGKLTLEDLTQQTQDGFGTHEFDSQHQKYLTQQTQDGFGKLTQDDLTQQTQDGFGKLKFGSEHQQSEDMNQQSQDMTQQSQNMAQKSQMDSFAQQTSGHHSQQHNEGTLNTEYHHKTGQQTQNEYGKLEMGSQVAGQHELRTQQIHGELSKLEHGNQQQEDLTRQTQHAFGVQQEDLSQQTQDEFGKLEFAGQKDLTQQTQQEDLTQQTQDGFGGQQEDLSQQTQDEFGKLEFAGQEDLTQQTQQEDLTQQTQDEFGKLEFAGQEDLTQQTQDGFGGQQEDLNQQTQDEFGKLEFDQQQQQQQQDLTQQTQDGFGKLEITSQNQGTQYGRTTQHQSQYSRSHSYNGSNSYSTNYNYGAQRVIAAETTQNLTQQQKAHETLDVTQQVQKLDDLKLEEQKESDFNQMSSHDILAKQTNVDETLAEEDATEKPGFWKRVGSKITKTYEQAKVSLG